MPYYERVCRSCGHKSADLEPIKYRCPEQESIMALCPKCGLEGSFNRIISAHAKLSKTWEDQCRGERDE